MSDHLPGRPIWLELYTADTDAARAFYGGLFGWTVEDSGPELGNYALFLRDGAPVAGLMQSSGETPDAWSVYLESDNAEDTVAMAVANGGQVIVEAMQVGDLGHMAMVADPGGAAVGIWQPGAHPGFAALGEEHAPGWFEVLSNDYDATVSFYRNAFGWDTHTMSDTPEFRYTTLGEYDHSLAGIMAADGPSHWSAYLMVGDADDAVARAVGLGGSEVDAPADTPYGRLATIADPSGVPLKLMGPNRG
ncbi:VOC family protein [Nocardioides sp. URHA0020]|uniref:VOC family protein n=1 Tax=Nocardioides sp. URHA0020 TaxID=1380392 RepID=UPI00048D4D23|nr:VOC family protein [Nocardioides sp. URHA0020]